MIVCHCPVWRPLGGKPQASKSEELTVELYWALQLFFFLKSIKFPSRFKDVLIFNAPGIYVWEVGCHLDLFLNG